MAARRVAHSAVKWAELAERIPVKQREAFRNLKAKTDAELYRIQSRPEELPKINFEFYKSHLATPALAAEFEKLYASLSVPYPKDTENVLQNLEVEEKVVKEAKNEFVAATKAMIKFFQTIIAEHEKIPPPEQMTWQMFGYYFRESALDPKRRPTFWPHDDESQPDTTTMSWINTWSDKRNIMTHEEWEEMWYKKVEEQNKIKLAEAKRREEAEAAQIEAKK